MQAEGESNSLNPLLPLGLLALFLLLSLYVLTYAANSTALDRYAAGFPLSACPVCEIGHLEVEERPYRVLGVPRSRRTVRCNTCRSVLREVGRRRWRYTVDPRANQALFEAYNGQTLSESALIALGQQIDGQSQPRYLSGDDFSDDH